MEFLVKFASAFMSVFQAGGANFVSWVTGIIPTILMLLVMMNAIIALIGDERIEVIAKFCTSNPVTRYAVLPWVSAFMLGNPMALSMGKFMPEFYKPSYYASASYHCHTNSGIFPHINPSEIMIYLGIAQGLTALGLDSTPLALRYMLVGFIIYCPFFLHSLSTLLPDINRTTTEQQADINPSAHRSGPGRSRDP